jgi:hypothetical protein
MRPRRRGRRRPPRLKAEGGRWWRRWPWDLGFGRIVASEREAPNTLAISWSKVDEQW